MREGIVCDCTRGGVDAEQPPHINDPVRGNPLHPVVGTLLLESHYNVERFCGNSCTREKPNLENDIRLVRKVDDDVNGHRED